MGELNGIARKCFKEICEEEGYMITFENEREVVAEKGNIEILVSLVREDAERHMLYRINNRNGYSRCVSFVVEGSVFSVIGSERRTENLMEILETLVFNVL